MKSRPSLDRPVVTARAVTIRHEQHVPYWIVLDYQDGLDLLQGLVSESVMAQVIKLVHRDVAESHEAYAARRAEGRDEKNLTRVDVERPLDGQEQKDLHGV